MTTQTKSGQTPCLEWDSNPVFQRVKTYHALDRMATVIGMTNLMNIIRKSLLTISFRWMQTN
jgi:hypothetical protein